MIVERKKKAEKEEGKESNHVSGKIKVERRQTKHRPARISSAPRLKKKKTKKKKQERSLRSSTD